MRLRLVATSFIVLTAISRIAGAQTLSNGTLRQCFDAAPQSEMRRVAAFITTDAADSAKPLLKPAELLLEILGERVRASLGAKPGDLPVGEPVFTKENVRGAVLVTLYRDGRLNTVVKADTAFPDPSSLGGARKLESLLHAAWDDGEKVFWPENVKEDSVQFRIFGWIPPPKKDGTPAIGEARFAIAVFSIALPWMTPAVADDAPKPVYPDGPRSRGMQADISMSFVVDTTGFAMISTLKDVLPPGAPIPVGEMADAYREFVRAAAEAIPKMHFHAATIAGCRVRQRVVLPFYFKLSGAP